MLLLWTLHLLNVKALAPSSLPNLSILSQTVYAGFVNKLSFNYSEMWRNSVCAMKTEKKKKKKKKTGLLFLWSIHLLNLKTSSVMVLEK